MLVCTVANLKGGSSKTTTAAFLAHAWAARGARVLVVDADPQGSAMRWAEDGSWTIPTLGLPSKELHRRLPALASPATFDAVVIDTPPLDETAGIVYSALRAASLVVVPMAPTMMELDRLPDVLAAIEDVSAMQAEPSRAAVLLTRTVARASSTDIVRGAAQAAGWRVLETMIPRRETVAQAYRRPVTAADSPAYVAAADELWPVEGDA